ncbi:MAG: hypothetical protein M3Z23_07465 [Acidobacteriota bacterium]|nr:hypothetical protein [Acidobacteriota bacterium]
MPVYLNADLGFDEVRWATMRGTSYDSRVAFQGRSLHGGGRLFRNYMAQYLVMPSGGTQQSIVEIQLTNSAYAWAVREPGSVQRITAAIPV